VRKRGDDATFYAALGARLRTFRGKRTQGQVALAVGLSRTSWVNIEKGNQAMTVAALARYATALGVSPADILDGGLAPLADIDVRPPSEYRSMRDRLAYLEAEIERLKGRPS
jgi:transcriptional regulator with XRE-family HTH domain